MIFILFSRWVYASPDLFVPGHSMLPAWRHNHRRDRVPSFHSSSRSPSANSAEPRNRRRNNSTISRGNLAAMHRLPQLHAIPHGGQFLTALTQGANAQRLHAKISLRTTAALWNRIAEPGCNVTFIFQAIQRPVQRADSQRAPGALLNFLADRHSVCVFTQAQNGQQYNLLKFSEMLARGHLCSA